MSLRFKNIQQVWRGLVLLALLGVSFHKGWDWILWIGFVLLTLTDPATYQKQPRVPRTLGVLVVVGFLLVMSAAVTIECWKFIHGLPENAFWSLGLIACSVLAVVLTGALGILKSEVKSKPEDGNNS